LSSFIFDYTIDQAKDCINEAESQLRDLVSTVFSSIYGLDWENSQAVWDQTTRQKLEVVRYEEKKRFPNQRLSDRLIDYSDILHLKSLIQKNWQYFDRIFASKDKTMSQFDMVAHVVKTEKLAKLRATFLLFGYYSFCICPADTS